VRYCPGGGGGGGGHAAGGWALWITRLNLGDFAPENGGFGAKIW